MILAIRKPIARFMRYAFGRQYIFVLTNTGKMKLRRVFRSEWDGSRYVRADDVIPPALRVAIDDDSQREFKGWRTATFTEAERRAGAVVDAMETTAQDNSFYGGMRQGKAVKLPQTALDFAAFKKAMQSLPTP